MTNHNDKEDIGRLARMSGLDTEVDGMLYVVSLSIASVDSAVK